MKNRTIFPQIHCVETARCTAEPSGGLGSRFHICTLPGSTGDHWCADIAPGPSDKRT